MSNSTIETSELPAGRESRNRQSAYVRDDMRTLMFNTSGGLERNSGKQVALAGGECEAPGRMWRSPSR